MIGAALSLKVATLREMEEFYSVRDVHDLIEVAVVDARNRRRAQAAFRESETYGR